MQRLLLVTPISFTFALQSAPATGTRAIVLFCLVFEVAPHTEQASLRLAVQLNITLSPKCWDYGGTRHTSFIWPRGWNTGLHEFWANTRLYPQPRRILFKKKKSHLKIFYKGGHGGTHFNPSTWEIDADVNEPGLFGEFQHSQGYVIERPCLKTNVVF